MRTLAALFALVLFALAPRAHAVEHGKLGLGVNSSVSLAGATGGVGVAGLGTSTGALSLRAWLNDRFAIDPQLGMAVSSGGGATNFGMLIGSRFLYSLVNATSLRFNFGGELLASFGSVSTQGGGSSTFAAMTFGLVAGVEYFFSELRNFSFDVYFGIPFNILMTPDTNFTMTMGGNVIAGFHYYF